MFSAFSSSLSTRKNVSKTLMFFFLLLCFFVFYASRCHGTWSVHAQRPLRRRRVGRRSAFRSVAPSGCRCPPCGNGNSFVSGAQVAMRGTHITSSHLCPLCAGPTQCLFCYLGGSSLCQFFRFVSQSGLTVWQLL